MPRNEQEKDDLKKLKRRLALQLTECALALIIFTAGVIAFMTKAWFVKNEQVSGTDNSVSSAATTSLFIESGTTLPTPRNYYTIVSHEWQNGAALYPISTKNCANWWYASRFGNVLDGNGNATLEATQYTQLTVGSTASNTVVSEANNVGTYLNSLENNLERVAYLYEDYMLYTNDQELNVYLHPTDPITVAYKENATVARQLNEAIRVAIVVGDLKIFYAPVTETGAGNSTNAVTGFSNVKDATSVEAFSMTDLSAYKAVAVSGDPYSFTAGTTSLGTATTSGLHVRTYVWLEGTDAQALIGMSDKDTKGLIINVNFVGVAQGQ